MMQILGAAVRLVIEQLFPAPVKLIILPKCKEVLKERRLSESDVTDVFRHGQEVQGKPGIVCRTYPASGQEICLYYFRDRNTGEYKVTSAWQKPLRTSPYKK
jgi:hypothetical protein